MVTKICKICDEEKKLIYFYYDYTQEGNRSSKCSKCTNKEKKAKRKERLKAIKNDPRRNPAKRDIVLYKRRPNSNGVSRVYHAENIPLFMQFNHLIYKHVKKTHGLNFGDLNLLLFVFPLSPFPRKDFLDCRLIMNYKKISLMKSFMDKELIYIWRPHVKRDGIPTLYDFTDKGKKLVRDIHEWATGKQKIPEVGGENALALLARIRGI